MFPLSYKRSFLTLICLLSLGCYDTNSSTVATSKEKQLEFIVSGSCNVNFDPKKREFKLASKITVDAQSPRTKCMVRINTSNAQKQVRLVPLTFKGEVKKAPATVTISLISIGGASGIKKLPILSKNYTSVTKFNLTDQIPKTNYLTTGTFGINLILATSGGELELTEMKFALQQK